MPVGSQRSTRRYRSAPIINKDSYLPFSPTTSRPSVETFVIITHIFAEIPSVVLFDGPPELAPTLGCQDADAKGVIHSSPGLVGQKAMASAESAIHRGHETGLWPERSRGTERLVAADRNARAPVLQ
jgi:hypothetical protein